MRTPSDGGNSLASGTLLGPTYRARLRLETGNIAAFPVRPAALAADPTYLDLLSLTRLLPLLDPLLVPRLGLLLAIDEVWQVPEPVRFVVIEHLRSVLGGDYGAARGRWLRSSPCLVRMVAWRTAGRTGKIAVRYVDGSHQ